MKRRRWMMFATSVPLLLIVSHAQQDSASVLKSLAEQAKEYQRAVPNFTCNEVVTTTMKSGGKLLRRIEFQADVRVHRKPDQSLAETFLISTYMGKPRPEGKVPILLYVNGGFGAGIPSFIGAENQTCYDYSISGNRIDFNARKSGDEKCHAHDTTGFVLLDAAGKLLHGEIRNSLEESVRRREPLFAQMDYVDVRLDDRVFRLPSHLYAEVSEHGVVRTFEAYYTSCRLFTAKVTIWPGDGVAARPSHSASFAGEIPSNV